jgi:hypothetical protein
MVAEENRITNIIGVMKLRSIRGPEQVARMGGVRSAYIILVGIIEEGGTGIAQSI